MENIYSILATCGTIVLVLFGIAVIRAVMTSDDPRQAFMNYLTWGDYGQWRGPFGKDPEAGIKTRYSAKDMAKSDQIRSRNRADRLISKRRK